MVQLKLESTTTNIFDKNEWQIVLSDKSNGTHHCICGHNVKRITYVYNKNTKELLCIGTTCVKKYGIYEHMKNGILLLFIKNMIHTGEMYDDSVLKTYIQDKYLSFREKIMEYSDSDEIDYYDVVAPFRRLLNDVCDLVTEYKYDLTVLLKEIEKDVDSMNSHTKHIMIDETVVSAQDFAPDIISDAVVEVPFTNSDEPDNAVDTNKLDDSDTICLLYDINAKFIEPAEPYYVVDSLYYQNIGEGESEAEPFEIIEQFENELMYDPELIDDSDIAYETVFDSGKSNDDAEPSPITQMHENKEDHTDESIQIELEESVASKPTAMEIEPRKNARSTTLCENIQIEPMKIGDKIYKLSVCCNQPYCYCDLKYRFYILHLEIAQLRKDMTEFNNRTASLLKQARNFQKVIDNKWD